MNPHDQVDASPAFRRDHLRRVAGPAAAIPKFRRFLRAGSFLGLLFAAAVSAVAAESAAILAARQADQARLEAMMAGDGAALGRLMSDELMFVHSDGRIESKADYVRNLTAGDTEYAEAAVSDVRAVEPGPGVVVLIGAQTMRKRLGAAWSKIDLRYMAIWRNEGGAWRMFAWQSMRPAGNSTVKR